MIEYPHLCVVECLELLCVTDEPVKLWDVKVEVHGKYDVEVVEKRDIDSGQKVLQILMNASAHKFGESGEKKTCGRRPRSACCVGTKSKDNAKMKSFESGHHCQGSGQ